MFGSCVCVVVAVVLRRSTADRPPKTHTQQHQTRTVRAKAILCYGEMAFSREKGWALAGVGKVERMRVKGFGSVKDGTGKCVPLLLLH